MIFYPSSFLLLPAYPQSLVLFLSLASYLAARKGRPVLTFVFGLAAGLTHLTAIPLMFLLVGSTLLRKERRWTGFLPALGPVIGVIIREGSRSIRKQVPIVVPGKCHAIDIDQVVRTVMEIGVRASHGLLG